MVEGGSQFRVCEERGLEPAQEVPPGTFCRDGALPGRELAMYLAYTGEDLTMV